MTWKEFKERVEAAGVKDHDLIGYIDISDAMMAMSPPGEPFCVMVDVLKDGRRKIEVG